MRPARMWTRGLKFNRPGRPPCRSELLHLLTRAEFRMRELASDTRLDAGLRYEMLQIANPLLVAVVKQDGRHCFLDKRLRERRRLRRRRRNQEQKQRDAEREAARLARHRECWGRQPRGRGQAIPQIPVEHAPLPEICLRDIGEALTAVADKLPGGAWRWAIPPVQMTRFNAERAASRPRSSSGMAAVFCLPGAVRARGRA